MMKEIYKSSKIPVVLILIGLSVYLLACIGTIFFLINGDQGLANTILILIVLFYGYFQIYNKSYKYLKNYDAIIIREDAIFTNNQIINWIDVKDIDQAPNHNFFYVKLLLNGREKEIWCFNRFQKRELIVLNHRTKLVKDLRTKIGKGDLD